MTLRVAQISDSHISAEFPQRAVDLENCIELINTADTPADLVIHTGDIAHDALAGEYNTAKRILDTLKVPFFVLAGNRDKRAELINVFSDAEHLRPDAKWVQYSIERYPVRLLVIDTVSEASNKGRFCADRLQHLEQMLDADTQRPVALFLHHPPFAATEIPDPWQYEDWSEVDRLGQLLARYSQIQGIYCGHVHRNISSSIAGIACSALTCLAGDLRKGKVSDAERKLPVVKTLELSVA